MNVPSLVRLPLALVVFLAVLCPPSSVLRLQAAPLKEANVTRIVNDVRVMEVVSNAQKPATLNQTVRDQQAVVTGVQSRAELLFTDKTLTRIGANSVFTFKEGTRDMDLKRGTMLLQVPKGAGGAQIKTAAVTAAITGTTLLVEYQPGAGAELQTFPGTAPAEPAGGPVPSAFPILDPAPASTGEGAVASDVDGNVRILSPGESDFRPLREGEAIPAGSSLMTADSGSAVVSPAPGVALRLLPGSILRVDAAAASGNTPKVRLDLKEGGVINMISKSRFDQVDYQITTPQGVCAARGTVFAVFVSKGRVLVLGAHGASVFKGQSVGAGKAVAFGAGGGAIPPTSGEFQGLLNLTLSSLNRAARQGLIPPSFLPQVRKQLEKSGIRLDPAQQQQLQPPSSPGNPPAPVVAGGSAGAGAGKGFAKIVVLEGQVRVFITGKLGESMVIGPGQMLIFPPNTARLPEAVDVDLDLLVKTSKLVQEMDAGDGAAVAGVGELSFAFIDEAVGEQMEEIQSGTLGDTNLIILDGDNLLVLSDEQLQAIENVQNVIGSSGGGTGPGFDPALTGPLTTIAGLSVLDNTTTVSTNPTITQGVTTYDGRIMTGNSSYDLVPTKAEYLFGAESAFDTAIEFQPEAPVPAAAFRFTNLTINGPFPIDLSGSSAQKVLYLISENGITYNGSMDISPLGGGGGLALVAANGSVDLNGSVVLGPANLVAYGRGAAGDVNFNSTGTLDGGSVTLLAEHDVNVDGTVLNGIDFSATAGNYVYVNGSVTAQHVNLDAESGFGAGGVALAGAGITADTVDIFAPFLNLGLVSFAPLGPKVDVNLQADSVLLTHDQLFGTPANVHLNTTADLDANGHSYQGARQINVGGNIVNAANIGVDRGNLFAAGNVNAAGLVQVTDDGTHTRGIITVNGSLTADTIYADGNVQAGNISATTGVTAGGTTSSIMTPGGTLALGTGAVAAANGMIEVGTLSGNGATVAAPTLRINNTGSSTIGSAFVNTIQAQNADLTADNINVHPTAPANGNIQANKLSVAGTIFYGGLNPGNNGFNLQITTVTDMGFSNSGSDILAVDASGAANPSAPGGNGGFITLSAPRVKISTNGELRSLGGDTGLNINNGGNGGTVDILSPTDFDMNGGLIDVSGGTAGTLGGEGGNGGLARVSTNGDLKLQGNATILAAAGAAVAVIPMSSTGGTIELGTTGGEMLLDGAKLATSDKTSAQTIAARGGLIKLISSIAYGSPNPSSNRAIQIKNSSDLYAMTNMSGGVMGVIDIQATGANGNVEIDASTLRADIIKIGALTSGGNLVIGNSTLDANSVLKLYGGTNSGNGVIFAANTTLSGSAAKYIRGDTVTINNGVSVNVTGSQAQVFANTANYTGWGGNNNTTGTFTGSGAANPQPLANAPAF